MTKKVLIYSTFLMTGGLERVLIDYVKMLKDNNIDVSLLIDYNLGVEKNTLEPEIPAGINYSFVKGERISKLIYFFRTIGKKYKLFNLCLYSLVIITDFIYYHLKVKRICRQGQYSHVIVFFQLMPAYVTSIKGIKTHIWLHGAIKTGILKGILGRFKGAFYGKINKFDSIITIVNEMKEELLEVYPQLDKNKVKVIYNPINKEYILTKSSDNSGLNSQEQALLKNHYICHVSRVDEKDKDITTLIHAYAQLKHDEKIAHKLYIIGNGASKTLLEHLVMELNLQNDILFLGNQRNPYIFIKHSSALVLSTKSEGCGMVLLEGMVLGIPVLSSNCKTGPAEILQQGKCGLLNDVGDVDQLSTNIYTILNDSHLRDELVKNGNARITEFSSKEIWKVFQSTILNSYN